MRKTFLIIDGILLFLSLVIGVHYSVYVANIKYNSNSDIVFMSNVLDMVFEDNDEINIENLENGQRFTKSFSVKNTSNSDMSFNIFLENINNNFDDLVYELYEGEKLQISTTFVNKENDKKYIKLNINIQAGEEKKYTINLWSLNNSEGKTFNAKLNIDAKKINDEIKTATNYILLNKNILTSSSSFNNTSKNLSEESGLYKDENTSTYYFRGEMENNYVYLANELYRIVEINEKGNIKIVKNTNIEANYAFNENSKNEGASTYSLSNIKTVLEEYYTNNLLEFDNLISTENFCEKVIVKSDYYKESDSDTIYSDFVPEFKCSSPVELKIGLLTYEDVIKAGLYYNTMSSSNYLTNGINKDTWIMTSAGKYNNTSDYYAYKLNNNGSIYESLVSSSTSSIRPVVNIKGTLNVSGDGTYYNPYIFSE